jgi:hypothetical protein
LFYLSFRTYSMQLKCAKDSKLHIMFTAMSQFYMRGKILTFKYFMHNIWKLALFLCFCIIQVPSFLKITMWYIFRSSAHTLVRTRTIPNSKNRVLQWHIQFSFKMAVFHWATNIYFTQFRWIFKELCRFPMENMLCCTLDSITCWIDVFFFEWLLENPKIWTRRIYSI